MTLQRFLETEIMSPGYVDYFSENFDQETIRKIRDNPLSWLNSLPMTEYAHTLLVYVAHRFGSDPTQYSTVLYNHLVNPILARYYRELENYRLLRAIKLQKFSSTQKYAPVEGHITLRDKMSKCTVQVKRMLRLLCESFLYIRDLPVTHAKVRCWVHEVKDLAENKDIADWTEEMEAFVNKFKNMDFAADIALITIPASGTVTAASVVTKVNELCTLFNIAKITDEDPYFADVKEKVDDLVTAYNLELMDGSTSYKKLAEKINELITNINNQKTRAL